MANTAGVSALSCAIVTLERHFIAAGGHVFLPDFSYSFRLRNSTQFSFLNRIYYTRIAKKVKAGSMAASETTR